MSKDPKHIVIISGQHMVSNPRVWKEANTLVKNGYKITVHTTFFDKRKVAEDRNLLLSGIAYKGIVNLVKGDGSSADIFFSRLRHKLAQIKKRILNLDSKHLFLYNAKKQIGAALSENADLYIAHQETGLIIGCELLKLGKKVAFDIEDWYSRDYIDKGRPIDLLCKTEAYAIKNGAYISCPSCAMAEALGKVYCKKNPQVIYNGFSIAENEGIEIEKKDPFSLVWFSQVIGPERGLESLIKVLSFIELPLKIHFIGKLVQGFKEELERLNSNKHRFYFHEPMRHRQLLPFISKFAIGLALENKIPDSRDTTITNKILQYLQAGLRVIATDTLGQMEISKAFPEAVLLVEYSKPSTWGDAIEKFIAADERVNNDQIQMFRDRFSWEAQEVKLLSLVSKAALLK